MLAVPAVPGAASRGMSDSRIGLLRGPGGQDRRRRRDLDLLVEAGVDRLQRGAMARRRPARERIRRQNDMKTAIDGIEGGGEDADFCLDAGEDQRLRAPPRERR